MSFGYYMNMEKLALSIAQEHIEHMDNENTTWTEGCPVLDTNKFQKNIESGFVVITQLNCYFESFLNTILNACMDYDGEVLLRCSIEEKIHIIFMYYQKPWETIKGQNCWSVFRKTTTMRNNLMHYKKTYIGDGSETPSFALGKEDVASFFTRQNMEAIMRGYLELTEKITECLGLGLCREIGIISCDGVDPIVNYVYDPRKPTPN